MFLDYEKEKGLKGMLSEMRKAKRLELEVPVWNDLVMQKIQQMK